MARRRGGVFYCGYNSEHSYGANSFFVQGDQLGGGEPRAGHPGNLLIDSPRWTRFLAEPFEAMGAASTTCC